MISGRNAEGLKQAAKELGVRYFLADMSDSEKLELLAKQFGDSGLDVLVNNAAIANFSPFQEVEVEELERFFQINFFGAIMLTKNLLSALEKMQGAVVNISSIATKIGVQGLSVYVATKGALEAFSRSLAVELAPKNIRVSAIAVGATKTPMFGKELNLSAEKRDVIVEKAEGRVLLKRMANPIEIVEVILAQVESKFTTGAVWTVDGGRSIT